MKPNGAPLGPFRIEHQDMGGWLRIRFSSGKPPDDLPLFLSHSLTSWFRQHTHLRMTHIVPIQANGNTVELHAWYEQVAFPDMNPMAKQQGSDS